MGHWTMLLLRPREGEEMVMAHASAFRCNAVRVLEDRTVAPPAQVVVRVSAEAHWFAKRCLAFDGHARSKSE